jgi:hypothetical protein
MRPWQTLPMVLCCSLALACAPTAEREPAAHATGWVELAIRDRHVPADPLGEPGSGADRPPPCEVELELDGRSLLATPLAPTGSAPPYAVDTKFRVEAPAGRHRAAVYYSACRTAWGQLDGREVEIAIDVHAGHVTRLEFDGARVVAFPPTPSGRAGDQPGG